MSNTCSTSLQKLTTVVGFNKKLKKKGSKQIMEKTLKQPIDLTKSKTQYYTIYFPAFSTVDEIFLSTDKKELEEDYANYLIKEHSDTIYDRTVIINPTLKYTRDEFEKHLTTLPPNEVLLLDASYVKEINYPHMHILVENKNGKKLELGEIAIADTNFDMRQIVNKETLTIEDLNDINSCLEQKDFHQIPYTELSTKQNSLSDFEKHLLYGLYCQQYDSITDENIDFFYNYVGIDLGLASEIETHIQNTSTLKEALLEIDKHFN